MSGDTLLLNQGYEPVASISWQKAITLLFKNKIEILEEYSDKEIRSVSFSIKMPAVVRFIKAFTRRKSKIRFSRQNIFLRDKGRCQYCGLKVSMEEATFDHLIAKSKKGTTTWKNIVIACSDCNTKKGDKTPEQAGMRLLNKPIEPDFNPFEFRFILPNKNVPTEWTSYLTGIIYWNVELDKD